MNGSEEDGYRESVGGATVLVLGILGIVFCGIFAPFAWIRGNHALRLIDDGEGNESERGLVVAGRACGIIGSVLLLITLFLLYLHATDTASHIH